MVILTVFFLFVIRVGRVINLIDFSVRFRFWKMNFFFPHRFDQVLRLRKSNKNFLFEPFDSYDWASDHKLTFLYPPYLKLKKIEENQFSINFPITNSIACALHLEILESNVDNCLYETGSK